MLTYNCMCCCVECSITQLYLSVFSPTDCSLPGFSLHGILQAKILEWVPFPTPGYLSNPGIEPKYLMSPALPGRFFTTNVTCQAHIKSTRVLQMVQYNWIWMENQPWDLIDKIRFIGFVSSVVYKYFPTYDVVHVKIN